MFARAWKHYTSKTVWAPLSVVSLFLLGRWRSLAGLTQGVLIRPHAWTSDYLITFWPNAYYLHAHWQATGQVPHWRTLLFSGSPLVGDPQSGLGYLPNVLHLVLSPVLVFNLLLWLHLAGGVFGMVFLARQAGLRQPGRLLTGMGFALFPALYAHWGLGHVGLVYAAVYVPWALGAAFGVARGAVRWAGLLGLALGAQAVNHPQVALYTGLMSLALTGLTLWEERTPRGGENRWRRALLGWGVAGVLALAVAAVVLLPMLRQTPYLARNAMAPADALVSSLSWVEMMGLVLPDYGGYAERLVYLGVPLLSLFGLGLSRRRGRWWGSIVALALLFALGKHFPPSAWLITHTPGLNKVRAPVRMWLAAYPVTLLVAGMGLEGLLEHRGKRPGLRVFRVVMAAYTMTLGAFVGAYWLTFHAWPPKYWLAALGWAVLTWGTWEGVHRWRAAAPWRVALLLGVITVDLWVMNASLVEVRPLEAFFDRPTLRAFLRRQQQEEAPWRVYSPSYSLPQHLGAWEGIEQANGVDPLYTAAYDALMERATGVTRHHYGVTVPAMEGEGPALLVNREAHPNPDLLGLLNVRYVLAAYPLHEEGLDFLGVMDRVWVYANRAWQPRAFLVGRVVPVAGTEEALAWLAAGDFTQAAAVEGATPLDVGQPQGEVRWLSRAPDQIRLRVHSDRPAWLVLSQTWHPGWHAWVDGYLVPYRRTDGALGGLPIPAGEHEVLLRFEDATYRWGRRISALGMACALGLLSAPWIRRRWAE